MWIAPTMKESGDYLFQHIIGTSDKVYLIWDILDNQRLAAGLGQGSKSAHAWDGFYTSTSTWATDGTEWHHIAFVFDENAVGDNMWLYTDGELKNSTAGSTAYFPEDTGTEYG